MPDEQSEEWRSLTFSQRAGKAPLPEALQAGKLTKKFRNQMWLVFERDIDRCTGPWEFFSDGETYWEECLRQLQEKEAKDGGE